jgi:hypothetical protein
MVAMKVKRLIFEESTISIAFFEAFSYTPDDFQL